MKTLVLRLSSLGDVVLATSFLEVSPSNNHVDWVVAQEYALLLEGHPKIRRLWRLNRELGLRGWIELARVLWHEKYDRVYDLHGSLRTMFLRFLFWVWSFRAQSPQTQWIVIHKKRWKLLGLFTFKSHWPRRFYPQKKVELFSKMGGGSGDERPNLKFLIQTSSQASPPLALPFETYLCVMPSSRWRGKCWPVEKYLDVIKNLSLPVVVLGAESDEASVQLVQLLKAANLPHFSGVGAWNLRQVAHVLQGAVGYFGNDTGLAILAESLQVPAYVVFGPTTPEMGFGPWQSSSRSLQASLWCRPCSKDGRACFRLMDRFKCMSDLKSESVLSEIKKTLSSHKREGP